MGSGLGDSSRQSGLRAGDSLGRYVLERELGHGGMGMVFKARDPVLDRWVALKVLLPEIASNPDAKSRFLKEGRTASKFRHPNVVTIFDVGEVDGFPYLVMDYLDGETLAARLAGEPGNRLAIADALRLLKPVFGAVATAHDAGIVHRDLKPDNIFLVGAGAAAHPYVLDFGIAKAVDAGHNQTNKTATGQIIGTPRYMAPEQLGGGKDLVGAPADQYALGVIVYECVAGRHPLGEDVPRLTILDLLGRIAHTLPEPIQTVVPEVNGRFSLAVARMLSKAADQRFPGVREALVALEGGGSDEDATARNTVPVPSPAETPGAKSGHAGGSAARFPVWAATGLAIAAIGAAAAWRASRPAAPVQPPAVVAAPASAPPVQPAARPAPETAAPPLPIPVAAEEPAPAAADRGGSEPHRSVHRVSLVQRRHPASSQGAPATSIATAGAVPAAPAPTGPAPTPAAARREPEKAPVAPPEKSAPPVRVRDNGAPVIR